MISFPRGILGALGGGALTKAATWRAFFEGLAVPAFALDHEGKVIAWNAACEQLTLNSAFGLRDEGVGAEFSRLSCVTWAQALAGGESGGR